MTFSYLSVCSGLEGASLAFSGLGAVAVGFSEIEKFPAAIIAERHGSNALGEALSRNAPPNFGDFTKIPTASLPRVDVLIGGTPCQAFSMAGSRLSLADARGNLTLAYAVLAHELVRSCGLRNAIWENVPGALSTNDNAFGCFLAGIVGADAPLYTPDGGSWPSSGMVAGPRARAAWRVLDAQYFGVAQRRERVFLVADFGNGADPSSVLFERKGVRGHSAARAKKRKDIAGSITASSGKRGGVPEARAAENLIVSTGDVSHCLNAGGMGRQDYESETLVAHALRGEGFDASEDGTGRGTPLVPVAFDLRGRDGGSQFEGPHETVNIRAASGGSSRSYLATRWGVRRLTPRECERLQGVPDDYTAIRWRGRPPEECPDGPRYKALGNSWAVPVVRWIGERLVAGLEARSL